MTVYGESLFVREYVKKNGYDFAYDFIESLHDTLSKIQVVHDVKDPGIVRDTAEKYRLLPNDALIAATCRLRRTLVPPVGGYVKLELSSQPD